MSNQQLAEELHKSIIRKFKKRKVQSSFKDNIWSADLADMQSISECNLVFRYLVHVIELQRRYAWVNDFQKILDLSNHKPSEIFVDKDSELYNRSMKSWLQGYDIEMYSAHNKGKLVVGERFI